MDSLHDAQSSLPVKQQKIRDKSVHLSGTFIPFPTEAVNQSIPELFEKQVCTHPNRLAIRTRYHSFTYEQLKRASNQLANAIFMQCGSCGKNIALLLEHGALQIVAILAVLKSGNVYVPLDAAYPRKRLSYMLNDSQAELIITNKTNISLADALTATIPIINIDELDSTLSRDNLNIVCSPKNLAFILYTSGSTGKPKGFPHTHCNVVIDIRNYTNAGHFCSDDRLLLVSSLSFADSVRTIYSALLNGATLYPFDIRTEGLVSLANWLIQNEITIYRSTPTVFRHFINTLNEDDRFRRIRLIYLSGEPVYRRDIELYREHFSDDCIFVNRLGTGEGLTFCSYFIDKETAVEGVHVPVGYPFPDKEVILLDSVRQPEDGTHIGEIAVKSKYFSPGYWNRPDLTQATFFPTAEGGESRLYRTGDLGQMHPDGCLVHLGRKDFQVKIRGYRVEIAEIEMALLGHAAIKEAIVRLWESKTGDPCLVAYLVPADQQLPTITEVRLFLAEILPDYMIPSKYVTLAAMPLLPNGKLNRRALPSPDRVRPKLEHSYVEPKTQVEIELAKIWAQVLDLDQVGITDSFFELGGHSLLATQIISRVIKTFRLNVSLKELFQSSTVKDMALVIIQKRAEKAQNEDIEGLLTELEALSNEEAIRRLVDEKGD